MVDPWWGRVGIENAKFNPIVFRVIADLAAVRAWASSSVTPRQLRPSLVSTDTRCQKSARRVAMRRLEQYKNNTAECQSKPPP